MAVSSIVLAIGAGQYASSAGRITPTTETYNDPGEGVSAAIDALEQSGDSDLALDYVYSAIASEGRTRSGQVNSLHLQSAALRLRRGDIDTALTYLNLARGFDDHAPMHDPQAFSVPASGAPFVPAWPLTMAAGAFVITTGAWLFGRLRRPGQLSS